MVTRDPERSPTTIEISESRTSAGRNLEVYYDMGEVVRKHADGGGISA